MQFDEAGVGRTVMAVEFILGSSEPFHDCCSRLAHEPALPPSHFPPRIGLSADSDDADDDCHADGQAKQRPKAELKTARFGGPAQSLRADSIICSRVRVVFGHKPCNPTKKNG